MKKIFQITLLIFLLLNIPVFADMMIPLTYTNMIFIPIIILIEILVFYVLNKKHYKKELNLKKIILVASLANIISSFFGLFITLINYSMDLFSFFITIIIEFFVFFIILRKSFKIKDLLVICIIINIFSYLFIFCLYVYEGYEKIRSIPISPQAAKNAACAIMMRESNGCKINVSTNSILVKNFDANKDEKIDGNDTLFEFCKSYFNMETDCKCKIACGCNIQCD